MDGVVKLRRREERQAGEREAGAVARGQGRRSETSAEAGRQNREGVKGQGLKTEVIIARVLQGEK